MTNLKSNYIIQSAYKSHCPKCNKIVDLLCTDEDMLQALKRKHWFYICWHCRKVFELGKGEVKREDESDDVA
jgi:uncharacterized protein with PIN domain